MSGPWESFSFACLPIIALFSRSRLLSIRWARICPRSKSAWLLLPCCCCDGFDAVDVVEPSWPSWPSALSVIEIVESLRIVVHCSVWPSVVIVVAVVIVAVSIVVVVVVVICLFVWNSSSMTLCN